MGMAISKAAKVKRGYRKFTGVKIGNYLILPYKVNRNPFRRARVRARAKIRVRKRASARTSTPSPQRATCTSEGCSPAPNEKESTQPQALKGRHTPAWGAAPRPKRMGKKAHNPKP